MTKILRIEEFIKESYGSNTPNDNTIRIVSFPGFYNTFWCDSEEDIDWEPYEKALGEFYVESIQKYYQELFGNTFTLQYEYIWSPDDYMYMNDIMYAKLITPNKKAFINALVTKMIENRENGLEKAIKEWHSSRSGFLSEMSNLFDEWINKVRDFNLEYIGYAMYYTWCANKYGDNLDKWNDLDDGIYYEACKNSIDASAFSVYDEQ